MFPEMDEFKSFHDARLGKVARRMIRRRMCGMWGNVQGEDILGVGYATPYLRPFMGSHNRVVAVTPLVDERIKWPQDGKNLVASSKLTALPFADVSFDRIILVHALEHAENPQQLLREMWRVLSGDGKLIIVYPNRQGLWARSERSPFGKGNPYSVQQIQTLLEDNLFTPTRICPALVMPPTTSPFFFRWASLWEGIGCRFWPHFSGVMVAEAKKEMYGVTPLWASTEQRPYLTKEVGTVFHKD